MKAKELLKKKVTKKLYIFDMDTACGIEFEEGYDLKKEKDKEYLKELNVILNKEIRIIEKDYFGRNEYRVSLYTNEERKNIEIKNEIKRLENEIKKLKEQLK